MCNDGFCCLALGLLMSWRLRRCWGPFELFELILVLIMQFILNKVVLPLSEVVSVEKTSTLIMVINALTLVKR